MKLDRRIGLASAIAIVVGQVVGVGIFLAPAGMAKSVGSAGWLVVIWLAVGLMTLCGALCYGELAARFPDAGGSYLYIREGYGRAPAFLYGWMVLLVLDPGLTAIFGVGFSSYFSVLYPLSPLGQKLMAVAVVLFAGTVAIVGTRISVNFLKVLTMLKVGSLLFIIVFGFVAGNGSAANLTPFFSEPPNMFGAFAGGLMGAFFAFAGWWEVTRVAGEIDNPRRNVPLTLVIGVSILFLLYALTSLVFMYLVPVANVANDQAFAALAGEALFGSVGGIVFAAIVAVSVFGTLIAYMLSAPRVYYAMANDGLFFKAIGRLHPKFGTPYLAILVQIALATILIFSGSFIEILGYFFFIVILFIGLTVAGLFWIHRRPFDGYRTPLFPATPIIFLLMTAIVLFFIAMQDPARTVIGAAVVTLGIPVYYFFFRQKTTYGLDKDDKI